MVMAKTINILKITAYTILFLALAAGFIAVVTSMQSCNKIKLDGYVPTRIDTVLDVRYYETVKRDTVIKLIEKPFYVKGEPVLIEYKKVDTVFIENAKKLDLVLSLKKSGNRIDAYTINFNDTILKKTIYTNIGNDFILTSQAGKVFIKSKRFYFNGVNAALVYQQPLDADFKKLQLNNAGVKVSTGLNYMDMISLDAGLQYTLKRKELFAFTELNFRFLK